MQEVDKISVAKLYELSERMYNPLVKAVVDIEEGRLVVDAELHVDIEQYLLEQGSQQSNLWGINLWPESFSSSDFIEFDSIINIRPSDNNRSRGVDDVGVQNEIMKIVRDKVFE